jgi:hypothetical protein
MMSQSPALAVSDPKLAALALATGGRLTDTRELSNGRLEFVFTGVPQDLAQRVLNDEVQVSAKRFINSMEGILAIIAHRRHKGPSDAR